MDFTNDQKIELHNIWNLISKIPNEPNLMNKLHYHAFKIAKTSIENNENPYYEVMNYWKYINDIYRDVFIKYH